MSISPALQEMFNDMVSDFIIDNLNVGNIEDGADVYEAYEDARASLLKNALKETVNDF